MSDLNEWQNRRRTSSRGPIRLLLADDSLVFRRLLGDILAEVAGLEVVGEAENGIVALEMLLKSSPDVLLLDLEMPLMDGMTALQHLLIHRPTPTVIFSSLSEEGTARAFDTLKNGAVDFVSKNALLRHHTPRSRRNLLVDKIGKAAKMVVHAREPLVTPATLPATRPPVRRIVFCEECGGQEVVEPDSLTGKSTIICRHCGDPLDPALLLQARYRRNTFITVLGGGDGSFSNLLDIVPKLPAESGGALLAVIDQPPGHVEEFCSYLDAVSTMKIIRARAGTAIEGGTCAIVSARDFLELKPFAAQPILQKIGKGDRRGGSFDGLLASIGAVYKERAAGVVLSGEGDDGCIGMPTLMAREGAALVLHPDDCFNKEQGRKVTAACFGRLRTVGIKELVAQLGEGKT
jgi:two-component system, chemotaxis family, protein-glutamate methylesterase/glutaminase